MRGKEVWPEIRCLGSTIVGPRGQVVIPVNARKELGIDTGDTLLVFLGHGRRGLALLKADAIEQMLSIMSERLADFEKLLKNHAPLEAARGRSREEINEKED